MNAQTRIACLAAAALALLSACGGGSSPMSQSSSNPPSGNGTAMVALTDAPGDFLNYVVNVVSLKLTRADGTVVETVPATTQVDFAQLVNLSEIVSARQVPAGRYVAASLTLDFGNGTSADPNALIVIDNGAGGLTVPAANLIDGATSQPLVAPNNQLTLTLQLPTGHPLVVTSGSVANLALDFNLAASNTVAPSAITASTPASSVTVTVHPTLSASLTPDTSRQIRVRGALAGVTNTSSMSSYTVTVRPFLDTDDTHGQLVVNTTSTTAFTLNGTAYTGSAGLTALAALGTGTLTVAYGSWDTHTDTFTASSVYAGTSVPGAGLDSVEGTVIARSGSVLTLAHGLICFGEQGGVRPQSASSTQNMTSEGATYGALGFSRQIAVTVASTTAVTEDGQSGTFSDQDISVGQHLQVFGKLGTDSSGNATLDASTGSARLMLTPLWGQFTSAASGVVTLNLQSLDGRAASAFDFTGTGSSQNASAAAYTVSVPAALTLPATAAGAPIAFSGFVTPFGSAPPDFSAVTLQSFAATSAEVFVSWSTPGLTAPFVAPLSATNVVVSQSTLQSAAIDVGELGPLHFSLATPGAGLTLKPDTAASSPQFAIVQAMSHKIGSYSTFSDLVTALTTDLNGTTGLLGIAAAGPYDGSTGVLSADRLILVLND